MHTHVTHGASVEVIELPLKVFLIELALQQLVFQELTFLHGLVGIVSMFGVPRSGFGTVQNSPIIKESLFSNLSCNWEMNKGTDMAVPPLIGSRISNSSDSSSRFLCLRDSIAL